MEIVGRHINKLPYSITGPFLSKLIKKNFQDGMHMPGKRALATEWEVAILDTIQLLTFCGNPKCESKWFVMNSTGTCPFCGYKYKGFSVPILNIFKANHKNEYTFTKKQWVVHNDKRIYKWNVFNNIYLNENIKKEDNILVGKFSFENSKWVLNNTALNDLYIDGKKIPIGTKGDVTNGGEIIFGSLPHGLKAKVKQLKF